MFNWIPKAGILVIRSELLLEHGGLSGSVNEDALASTLARPQQLYNYAEPLPSIYELAASYGFGFAKNHCFKDGNKRVSLVAIDVFLQLNGYELIAEEIDAALTIESLAASEINEEELCIWIRENSAPYTLLNNR